MYGMKKLVFLLAIGSLMMTSCTKMIYLKDMRPNRLYSLSATELRIQPGDRLRIVVSSRKPELSAPYNLGVGGYQVSATGDVRTVTDQTAQENGYLVDAEGNIEFPVLGTLFVSGLTRGELSSLIKEHLKQEGHINEAIVMVEILNFKILLMGEVGSMGTMLVPEGKITLLEAIVRSGGLTPNAAIDKVFVIREDDGKVRMMENDLRTVSVLNSPSYYLRQNDIVYVMPKAAQRTLTEDRSWQIYGTILGLGGIALSVLTLLKLYEK